MALGDRPDTDGVVIAFDGRHGIDQPWVQVTVSGKAEWVMTRRDQPQPNRIRREDGLGRVEDVLEDFGQLEVRADLCNNPSQSCGPGFLGLGPDGASWRLRDATASDRSG